MQDSIINNNPTPELRHSHKKAKKGFVWATSPFLQVGLLSGLFQGLQSMSTVDMHPKNHLPVKKGYQLQQASPHAFALIMNTPQPIHICVYIYIYIGDHTCFWGLGGVYY